MERGVWLPGIFLLWALIIMAIQGFSILLIVGTPALPTLGMIVIAERPLKWLMGQINESVKRLSLLSLTPR